MRCGPYTNISDVIDGGGCEARLVGVVEQHGHQLLVVLPSKTNRCNND